MGTVALVHDFLTSYGGAERVLSELVEMFPAAPIYTLLSNSVGTKHFAGHQIISSNLQRSLFNTHPQFLLGQMPQAIESFDFSGYDTVISSSGAFSHGLITGPETFHLCYCHSPMRYAWDWHSEYLDERGVKGALATGIANQFLSNIRLLDLVSSSRPDRYVANSQTVQQRINHYYRQDSTIVYPPVNTSFWKPGTSKGKYAITVCRLSKYKRVDLLIEAAHSLHLPLVVVGEGSEKYSLQKLVTKLSADVTFKGRIDDVELLPLMQGAEVFLFAAEEDFGIAPVEALSCGIPVVALNCGGTAETVQNGKTGSLFDFPEISQISAALQNVLDGNITATPQEISMSVSRFSKEVFRNGIFQALQQ